jgi:hypothetical protein
LTHRFWFSPKNPLVALSSKKDEMHVATKRWVEHKTKEYGWWWVMMRLVRWKRTGGEGAPLFYCESGVWNPWILLSVRPIYPIPLSPPL